MDAKVLNVENVEINVVMGKEPQIEVNHDHSHEEVARKRKKKLNMLVQVDLHIAKVFIAVIKLRDIQISKDI